MAAWLAIYSLLVNSSSTMPLSATKLTTSASKIVRPPVTNFSPTVRSFQFHPIPSCFTPPLRSVRMHDSALGEHIEAAAIRAFDAPLGAQIEIDFGMSQRAAAAIAGYAISIVSDGLAGFSHVLSPVARPDH